MVRLADLEAGQKGLVRQLDGEHHIISRLAALGFTTGAPLTVLRNNSKGPVLVSLRGSRVALGHGEAKQVMILPDEETVLFSDKPEREKGSYLIGLAGQPNVGKSTLFNLLTGLNQHVGNWAGKTIEQKSGSFPFKDNNFTIVDLPGTYSLTANSDEERIARDFILKQKPDLVVAVVDAATLERNLYLVAELLLLDAPMVLALNMMDVAQREGILVEPGVLESALGIPVVAMSASRNSGVSSLLEIINRLLAGDILYQPKKPSIQPAHQQVLAQLQEIVAGRVPEPYKPEWIALKLLEGDDEILSLTRSLLSTEDWDGVHDLLYKHEDAILDIAGARYEWIARMVRAAVVRPVLTRGSLTARLDRVLTHPLWGSLILFVVLGGVFWLTYAIGGPIQVWLSSLVSALAFQTRSVLAWAPRWIPELLAGGVFGGLGMVLTFLPILAIFYAALGFLEDTGYLARIAYLTDRWMHNLGLHGKSFLPLLLGFGCNVPAVLGTRIIESRRARLLTILILPLIPCTARMAVVTVLVPVFFSTQAALVTWGLLVGNLLLLAGLGLVLHSFAFQNEHVAFIMELPLYHLPNPKSIVIYIWQNILGFLQKAGTIILTASLVMWGLSYFPNGVVASSFLAGLGHWLEPVGRLMGLPWQVLMALLTSVVAKENTIATLGVLYGDIHNTLPLAVTPAAGLAMLVFQMLFIPCIATVSAIRQETGSLRWTVFSAGLMLLLSLGFGIAIFQIGRLFVWG